MASDPVAAGVTDTIEIHPVDHSTWVGRGR